MIKLIDTKELLYNGDLLLYNNYNLYDRNDEIDWRTQDQVLDNNSIRLARIISLNLIFALNNFSLLT